ncbi:2-keto-4-pentenoate hydratase/2-oxohepta-3-ene-1,7-dioic acid hydratase in catechol pathway [Edaphobacter aggregans]|uniref:2-keto-4-pentenoate hydratase/2-oxohepta-3-ene-1,7-dioic acid hydratase in catechol pathway n=1 Tax=Edaphobacter aggregans TaxID=570835 RepID=A0A3R9P9S5_9BACT|nr:fumarylacetoacetate hydrolase family protein [Edaphobacter aggregans]RSL16828.1 2-keto-4-pentenoate hydratase/2-oxohepta-3-ene-1,7-dioic acid hydratase in catechol pathway [Edaphobacter aggregans]
MRYCKFLSTEHGAPTPRYAFVEERNSILWAVSPMEAPEEDHLTGSIPILPLNPTPLTDLRLLAPVTPSKILCIGRNYRDHATELGNEVPKEPLLFLKPPSALLAPNGVILMPALSQRVDYEGELAIVVGRRCRNLGPDEDPRPYIRGYTIVNDVTARDIQKSDGQWTRGKGWDTFCPTGPIVSNEIDLCGYKDTPAATVTVTTRLNGTVKQHGSTADLIFPIADLLRYISATMTLEPGDLIPTGTPAGVGPVQPGDHVEVEIDGLGTLQNTFAPER